MVQSASQTTKPSASIVAIWSKKLCTNEITVWESVWDQILVFSKRMEQ